MIMDSVGDEYPAGLGESLQSCGHVHSIAEDVVLLRDHIAKVDADPELDPLVLRDEVVALGHAPLHFHSAANGIHNARKLRQEAVAGILYHPAPVLRDLRI